jgi:AraC family L-rhamnose operon regulatory protein RhaS
VGSEHSAAEETVRLFLRDLENNIDSMAQEWTLAGMAAECGMGTTAFTQYCRRITNTSPLQHLNHLRLATAARMLHERPDWTVTQIAYEVGFHSSQYFATQFHRHFRKTPRAHRAAKA